MYNYIILGALIITVVLLMYDLYVTYRDKGKDAALKKLRDIVNDLFLAAEEKYGPKTGDIKMAWVIAKFYEFITPDDIKKFIAPDTVEDFLQTRFNEYKTLLGDYLDNGKLDNSITTTSDPSITDSLEDMK